MRHYLMILKNQVPCDRVVLNLCADGLVRPEYTKLWKFGA